MTAQQNTMWAARVTALLREGFGVEDMAVKLSCPVDDVRRGVEILRQEGRITEIVRRQG